MQMNLPNKQDTRFYTNYNDSTLDHVSIGEHMKKEQHVPIPKTVVELKQQVLCQLFEIDPLYNMPETELQVDKKYLTHERISEDEDRKYNQHIADMYYDANNQYLFLVDPTKPCNECSYIYEHTYQLIGYNKLNDTSEGDFSNIIQLNFHKQMIHQLHQSLLKPQDELHQRYLNIKQLMLKEGNYQASDSSNGILKQSRLHFQEDQSVSYNDLSGSIPQIRSNNQQLTPIININVNSSSSQSSSCSDCCCGNFPPVRDRPNDNQFEFYDHFNPNYMPNNSQPHTTSHHDNLLPNNGKMDCENKINVLQDLQIKCPSAIIDNSTAEGMYDMGQKEYPFANSPNQQTPTATKSQLMPGEYSMMVE